MTDRDNIGMMETVAVAIFNSGFHPADVLNGTAAKKWQEWDDEAARAMLQARAAMAAMREPTDGMISHPSYTTGQWSRRNIEAYIDAALSEGKTQT